MANSSVRQFSSFGWFSFWPIHLLATLLWPVLLRPVPICTVLFANIWANGSVTQFWISFQEESKGAGNNRRGDVLEWRCVLSGLVSVRVCALRVPCLRSPSPHYFSCPTPTLPPSQLKASWFARGAPRERNKHIRKTKKMNDEEQTNTEIKGLGTIKKEWCAISGPASAPRVLRPPVQLFVFVLTPLPPRLNERLVVQRAALRANATRCEEQSMKQTGQKHIKRRVWAVKWWAVWTAPVGEI